MSPTTTAVRQPARRGRPCGRGVKRWHGEAVARVVRDALAARDVDDPESVTETTCTSSPSTTSTLMVEIAATTKTSMAVPDRRCMRRWSSGLRVVKWAKKRCTTKPPIHAQWNEGESVEEGVAVGARRPHQEFDPYQAAVDQIADEDTETDHGKMEAEAVD